MRNKKVIISLVVTFLLVASGLGYFLTGYSADRSKEQNTVGQQIIKDEKKDKQGIQITHPNKWEDGEKLKLTENRAAYKLQIALDAEGKKILGHQKVRFRNNYKSALKEIVFHLYPDSYNTAETKPSIGTTAEKLSESEIGDIKIDSVSINGDKLAYSEDKQVLKIALSKELKSGEIADIELDFTLKIPKSRDRLGHFKEQYSITNWYPILSIYDEKTASWDENPFHPVGESNYSDTSDYIVEVAVPEGMVVVTTGVEVGKGKEGAMDKMTFQASNIRDFVLFMSKDYKVISREVDGIKVNSYYILYESTAKRMLDLACKSLKFFNDTYGMYPYPEYDVVESSLEGGAMEYPTVTQMGPYSSMNEEYKPDSLTFYDEAVVHETAHQWFYSTVGNNEFMDPVLDETFTSYATALFFENLYGEYNPLAVKGAFLRYPYSYTSPIYRPTDQYTWNDFGVVVYKIGPVVLEDLRRKVGQDKFLEIFKTYYETYKFKNASLEGFLKIVEEKAGGDVSNYVRDAFTSTNYSTNAMMVTGEELERIRGK